ncbi:MAG: dicarboxylate/amino acid:cation symporter [Ignavibacteria bacterium]
MKHKIKLHNKIFLGLIIGIVFGALFPINHHSIRIITTGESQNIENWQKVSIYENDSLIKIFDVYANITFLRYIKEYLGKKAQVDKLVFTFDDNREKVFTGVTSIEKPKTIPLYLKPLGDIFIRLLNMIAVPLVLSSLIVGSASLSDIKKVARIGGKTISIYLFTTVMAVTVGLLLVDIIKPGSFMPSTTKDRLIESYQDELSSKVQQNITVNIFDFLVNIVPKNPFKAIADGDFLQIVFFSITFGLFLSYVGHKIQEPVIKFFEAVSKTLILLVEKIMLLAPYAVFVLIASTVADFGVEILQTLFMYALTVILGLVLLMLFLYPTLLKVLTRRSVLQFYRTIKPIMLLGFSTSSSAATLPVELDICETKLGVPNEIASFVLPLGTTVNMDGTSLYQSVAAVFIAQVFGMNLTLSQQLTIILTAVLASIGTAPVPGVGLIMLMVVLKSVGIPEIGLALILGIDRFLDMCRTVPNVVGDTTTTVIVAHTENELGPWNETETKYSF